MVLALPAIVLFRIAYSAALLVAPLPRMARAPAAIALTMLW
jgi:hypothetical protein